MERLHPTDGSLFLSEKVSGVRLNDEDGYYCKNHHLSCSRKMGSMLQSLLTYRVKDSEVSLWNGNTG